MPRGVKGSFNYEVELQKIDAKIAKQTATLNDLKEQRTDLLERKRETEMRQLYAYMNEQNMSADEVLTKIKSEASD